MTIAEFLLLAVVFNAPIFVLIRRGERKQQDLLVYWTVTNAIHRDLLQMGYVPGVMFDDGKTRYDPKGAADMLCYGKYLLPSREYIIERFVKKSR